MRRRDEEGEKGEGQKMDRDKTIVSNDRAK